ncbi:MAG: hypothetical protein EI684_07550 [Candidatus Viridilinea halotolerans]|uniref:Uncharacterized protein n=1 Tax=Candidatus Viridilinea halotolerans TaxID=2491704 RepID=A0A426U358_9CHLR|nr:MAG: hypothetical protein EI684_07550 [Candidatus Viridilinea halotolerans]
MLGRFEFPQFDGGTISKTPVPDLDNPEGVRLGELALACVALKRDLDRVNETSHVFHLPALLHMTGATLTARAAAWEAHIAASEAQLAANQREIDELAFQLYGIAGEDRQAIEAGSGSQGSAADDEPNDEDDTDTDLASPPTDHTSLVTALISYLVGCAFGRFDVRYATGERPTPLLPDPFAPLPACSPGMLIGSDGLPLREGPAGYPLAFPVHGILVDDPDHRDDLVRRVRAALDLIFDRDAEAIEQEICQVLAIHDLRDYFRRPGKGGFWDDHLKRYAKSRRKAPIYWLLQSPKRTYALWLYLHRLDSDTLSKALVSYVEPRLRLEEERLATLRTAKGSATGRDLRQAERNIERQEALLSDIRELRDRLDRAVRHYLAPDLNDGVVLTIAPLHELVPWKEAKHYWEELLAGKYAWSSIGKQLRTQGLVDSR